MIRLCTSVFYILNIEGIAAELQQYLLGELYKLVILYQLWQ